MTSSMLAGHFYILTATKRLLKVVSAVLNFYKFQVGRLEVFTNLKEDLVSYFCDKLKKGVYYLSI